MALGIGQRAVLVVGVASLLPLFGWTGYHVVDELARVSLTTTTDYSVSTQQLTVNVDNGDLTLTASADNRVHVQRIEHYGLSRPTATQRLTGAGLELRGKCSQSWSACSVDYRVAVPAGFTVTAKSSAGDLSASGLSDTIDLESSAGDISADALSGAITLHSRAGDVNADDLRSARVVAGSAAGDVRLRFATGPTSVTATSSAGDVKVFVPSGVAYRVNTRSSLGGVTVDVATDSHSPRSITATTSAGDVTVAPTGTS